MTDSRKGYVQKRLFCTFEGTVSKPLPRPIWNTKTINKGKSRAM